MHRSVMWRDGLSVECCGPAKSFWNLIEVFCGQDLSSAGKQLLILGHLVGWTSVKSTLVSNFTSLYYS
jgi:hypothetical protein